LTIKVIAADSHPVTALGIETILGRCSGVTVIGALRSAIEIANLAGAQGFNVIVMDKEVASGCIGGTTTPLIKLILDEYPDVGVVLHSCVRNAAYVATLSHLGVHAMLDKEDVIVHLNVAVRAANARVNYISPTLAESSLIDSRMPGDVKPLSRCEIHVIRAVLSGHSVKDISSTRFRSKQTISTHKSNAMRKLQVTTDAELFRAFSENDFVLVELTCTDSSSC
jgi:two-component system, NarL family, captular synthesis response regulator RcsB